MRKISNFFDTRRVSGIVAATILSVLTVALTTYGVTTISTNISTGGTLDVTGATTLNGNVTLGDAIGDAITITGNATSSNAFNVAGNLFVNGRASTSGSTGNIATEGSLTVNGGVTLGDAIGDAITITGNATSSNAFNVTGAATFAGLASTSQMIVGGNSTAGTISGIVFGTCNLTAATLAASTTANFYCNSASGVRSGDKVFVTATSSLAVAGAPYSNQVYIRAASSSVSGRIDVDITNGFGETRSVGGTLYFWAAR